MDLNQQRLEIAQFLLDVREHIRASLETSEYENTSNLFHVTEAQSSVKLLQKCEQLLEKFADTNHNNNVNNNATTTTMMMMTIPTKKTINGNDSRNKKQLQPIGATTTPSRTTSTTNIDVLTNGINGGSMNGDGQHEDVSYLEMTSSKKIPSSSSNEYIAFNNSAESDKTFRCSTRLATQRGSRILLDEGHTTDEFDEDAEDAEKTHNVSINNNYNSKNHYSSNKSFNSNKSYNSNNHISNTLSNTDDDDAEEDDDNDDDDERQIYDICQVTRSVNDINATTDADPQLLLDCPYVELPAGHLAIQRSTKYGQLQRIEKRLFFDQSKKCYCGILNDWLLCYTDGPTSARPNITLHLKSNGTEIEHSGEGKRRELCFQITTGGVGLESSKRYVFQANNEVDAKEWIHAIEAAIRGDIGIKITATQPSRKLPTPPVQKRMTFVGNEQQHDVNQHQSADCIYEEPAPLYMLHEPSDELLLLSAADNSREDMAARFEYDVPKCPPQPLKLPPETEFETEGLLQLLTTTPTSATPTMLATTRTPSPQLPPPTNSPPRPPSRNSEKLDFQTRVKDVHSKLSSQLSAAGPSLRKCTRKLAYSACANEPEALQLHAETSTPTPPLSAKELKKQKKSNTPSPVAAVTQTPPPHKTATIGKPNGGSSSSHVCAEKSTKNWFLNRLNKTTSSMRSVSSGNHAVAMPTPASKCKQSEKENLLSNLEIGDSYEGTDSNPGSPILKNGVGVIVDAGGAKSKVNMIINQFESSGHMAMFSMEALAGNAVATFSSFCDSDCNNYEPIMTISTPPSSFMKKV